MGLYSISAKLNNGKDVSLDEFKGKVLLVVNTASACGFTPQYEGLEELYQKYNTQGFEVLAFPCNQFGSQEQGSDEEIKSFCDLRFKATFPLFSKVEVNGKNAHPLFNFLKHEKPGLLGTEKIKWNFTKFLIDRQGNVIERFAPSTKPLDMISEIEKLL